MPRQGMGIVYRNLRGLAPHFSPIERGPIGLNLKTGIRMRDVRKRGKVELSNGA